MSLIDTSMTVSGVASGTTARLPVRTLGQDDFLKLLVAQLSAQDPLNPQKDTDFIAQMASFSSLEQTRAMQTDLAGLRSDQQILQANGLIGRTVSVQREDGLVDTGVVTEVRIENGTPLVFVNGGGYALSQLLGMAPAPNPK